MATFVDPKSGPGHILSKKNLVMIAETDKDFEKNLDKRFKKIMKQEKKTKKNKERVIFIASVNAAVTSGTLGEFLYAMMEDLRSPRLRSKRKTLKR